MDISEVAEATAGIPFMDTEQATSIRRHIHESDIRDVLELGFAHGVSSCYIAAVLEERGRGHLTTMDRRSAQQRQPSIDELLGRLGLTHRVTTIWAERSFTWELMRLLEADPPPRFDLCYFDGGHTWDVTGFAFFLVDRMLRPGGWVLFDDLTWTIADSPSVSDTDWGLSFPEEERTTQQVRKVFELLVDGHPDYTDLTVTYDGKWGWARKRTTGPLRRLLRR